MKRIILFLLILTPFAASAQFEKFKDSVVQIYGIVMTADSLEGIPAVTVFIKGQNRGTITNDQGVFSIVALKGDSIEFTSIGFKPKTVRIPPDLEGNYHSMIQLMVTDAQMLAATIIRPRPTREQFERDFVNMEMPDDATEIARKNTDETRRRVLSRGMPMDGTEATNQFMRQGAQKARYTGQAPPQNIFNPFAWNEFIKAWKRGDFKNN
ncbi:carboxypeptidase-like regulatory domain-containing protein [Gynurincola endophyticus]|jgi:hypothetical protein|uniref:carboxypeptidase-like regulatory domain-containing protein n=1 Tax=Gynurincola endophyticus TaxID=2479004 RepID=UPI000F8D0B56|nr:carboxypeptidase-like regulatory domain-containing protein [Gynurincola endophyticus]